jgi:hypothetical protein
MTQPPPGQPPGPYGPPPPLRPSLPRHPDTLLVLILGCASVVVFPPTGPFAWYIGSRVIREHAENPGRWSSADEVKVGYVLGIIGSIFCMLIAAVILILVVVIIGAASG